MSARLLKKVLKEQEQKKQHVIEEEEQEELLNDDEPVSPDSGAGSSKNPFDLLNEGDDADEDNADQVQSLNPSFLKVLFFFRIKSFIAFEPGLSVFNNNMSRTKLKICDFNVVLKC